MTIHARRASLALALKTALAHLLYFTGAFHLWVRLAFRRRPAVLMYHRVLGEDESAASWSHPTISVTPATFERHLALIRRMFDVVSLEEYVARLDSGQATSRPACLVTFDDGWRDTRANAWPILRKYDVPAVVFLPVNFIGTRRTFWQEQLGQDLSAVAVRARQDSSFARRARTVLAEFGLDGVLDAEASAARATIASLVRTRKSQNPEDIGRMAAAVAALAPETAGQPADVDVFMDWADVRELAAAGVVFGGHSVNHWLLTSLTPTHAEQEIREARQVLEHHLEQPIIGFSYPNGDWNPQLAEMVRRAGYAVAFSTMRGREGGRFAMKRINIHEAAATPAMFLARVVGLF